LGASGELKLYRYYDMGSNWGECFHGYYMAAGDVIHSNVREAAFSLSSFDQDGRLYVRHVQSDRILVPEDSVREFDRLVGGSKSMPRGADELSLFYLDNA
jgi:hypothetical protein